MFLRKSSHHPIRCQKASFVSLSLSLSSSLSVHLSLSHSFCLSLSFPLSRALCLPPSGPHHSVCRLRGIPPRQDPGLGQTQRRHILCQVRAVNAGTALYSSTADREKEGEEEEGNIKDGRMSSVEEEVKRLRRQ